MNINWRKISLLEQQSIKDAFKVLDEGALRIALVVNAEDKLLGVITDGDVRRGLLKGITLSEPVSLVMNTSPKTSTEGQSLNDAKEMMESLDLLAIPVVAENGVVIDLHVLKESFHNAQYENPVFIMAGGFGTRLRPLTDHCPKPMLNVGGKPMLETIILQFKKQGFHNFYLSTHYLPEVIHNHFGDGSKFDVSIEYVYENQPLGTGGALGLLPETMPDLPLLMINGDVLTSVNYGKLLDFHNRGIASATMCVREFEYQVPYGVIKGTGDRVEAMIEKPIQKFYINSGIYVLNPSIFSSVLKNTKIDMPTLLEQQIEDNKIVNKYPIHEYWLDIGQMQDFERAQTDIKNLDI